MIFKEVIVLRSRYLLDIALTQTSCHWLRQRTLPDLMFDYIMPLFHHSHECSVSQLMNNHTSVKCL